MLQDLRWVIHSTYLFLKQFRLKPIIVSIFCLLYGTVAFADGSRDLYPSGATGSRAYLGSHVQIQSYNPFPTTGATYVYARAGDSIYVGSSVQGIGIGTIRLTAPNGTTYSSGNSTTVGRISNRAQELAGPRRTGVTNGYTPYARLVSAAEEGIWQVNFISQDTNVTNNPTNILADAEWSAAPGSGNMIAAWDASVVRSGALVTGRVFTYMFHGVMNTGATGGFTGKFYVLTKDGYNYLVDNNGQNGLNFAWFSNNNGIKDSTGNASYRSFNSTTNPPIKDPRTPDAFNDIVNKVFYTIPASDLPTTSITPTGNTWLRLSAPVAPIVSNFGFVGIEGTPNVAGTNPAGGNITFTASDASNYAIDIDVNGNGSYADAVDRRLTGSASFGSNAVYWDGKNGLGANVSGAGTITVRVFLMGGEVHFPFLDVEENPNGLIISRLTSAGVPITNADTVYWNDNGISVIGTGSNPVSAVVIGRRSTPSGGANVRKWSVNTCCQLRLCTSNCT
ncbi:MAG: hypothetical protein MUE96_11600 [Bacteroidia bacterium]|nr:hypothetical protein [Bacteroidia bacterium]